SRCDERRAGARSLARGHGPARAGAGRREGPICFVDSSLLPAAWAAHASVVARRRLASGPFSAPLTRVASGNAGGILAALDPPAVDRGRSSLPSIAFRSGGRGRGKILVMTRRQFEALVEKSLRKLPKRFKEK